MTGASEVKLEILKEELEWAFGLVAAKAAGMGGGGMRPAAM